MVDDDGPQLRHKMVGRLCPTLHLNEGVDWFLGVVRPENLQLIPVEGVVFFVYVLLAAGFFAEVVCTRCTLCNSQGVARCTKHTLLGYLLSLYIQMWGDFRHISHIVGDNCSSSWSVRIVDISCIGQSPFSCAVLLLLSLSLTGD